MDLSRSLLKAFSEATKPQETKEPIYLYATAKVDGTDVSVRIDGSDVYTPVETTAEIKNGERVLVAIDNHKAMIMGNMSSPAARIQTVEAVSADVGAFKILTAENFIATNAEIGNLKTENANIKNLVAEKATIESLNATNAEIGNLKAEDVNIKKLVAEKATIESLNATNAEIGNLKAEDANIKKLVAEKASIKDLNATNATIENLGTKYANIDFSNIGNAAMEYFYAQSGLIKNVTIGDATITGELIGVTIKGNLIEGGTVVADKLVIKGTDGLYYKLNTDGIKTEAEQTEYNSINGSVILANSIKATKIDVDDLVAFDATIGGFKITEDSIYSGVKESVNNTTRGIYLDNDGQIAFGDANNHIKYFKDTDGSYKLILKANDVILSGKNISFETAIDKSVQDALTKAKESGEFKGETGATGPQGEQGEKGEKGETGETGATGPQGEQGEKGDKGDPGKDGKMLYATSDTAASTAAKVATLTSGTLTLTAGVTVAVKFTYANTSLYPTLNINGTGAKKVYTNGLHSAYWSANQTAVFTYDGANWQVASSPVYASTVTVGNSAGHNIYIDGDSIDIRTGTTVNARFTEDVIDLGMNSESTVISLHGGTNRIFTLPTAYDGVEMVIQAKDRLFISTGGNVNIQDSFEDREGNIAVNHISTESQRVSLTGSMATLYANAHAQITAQYGSHDGLYTTNGTLLIQREKIRLGLESRNQNVGSLWDNYSYIEILDTGDINIVTKYGGTVNINNNRVMQAKLPAGGYWGMVVPTGTDTNFIRTTSSGLIPYAQENTSKIGTASYRFSEGNFDTLRAHTSLCTGSKTSATDNATGAVLANTGRLFLQNTTGNSYVQFYGPSTDKGCYISYNIETERLMFGGAGVNQFSFGQKIYTSGTIQSADAIYSGAGLYLAYGDDWSNARSIVIPFKDGSNHSVVYRGTDGLSVTFGWSGSSSYKTVSILSGQTVKYSNSSGSTTLSDERLKKDFMELDRWDTFFDNIEPCAFKMKTGASGRFHIGFKARQIEEALLNSGLSTSDFAGFVKMTYEPNADDEEGTAVYEAAGIKPGDDEYGLIYSEFTALNTYEIQKLKKRIDELEALIKEKNNEREIN